LVFDFDRGEKRPEKRLLVAQKRGRSKEGGTESHTRKNPPAYRPVGKGRAEKGNSLSTEEGERKALCR